MPFSRGCSRTQASPRPIGDRNDGRLWQRTHGGQLTLEGCGSCRLSTKNLRDALRSPTGGTVWRYYRIDGELMHVILEVHPDRGYVRLQHPSRINSGPDRMDYTAGLTWTEVSFGGRRWWFCCPISNVAVPPSTCRAAPRNSPLPRPTGWPTA